MTTFCYMVSKSKGKTTIHPMYKKHVCSSTFTRLHFQYGRHRLLFPLTMFCSEYRKIRNKIMLNHSFVIDKESATLKTFKTKIQKKETFSFVDVILLGFLNIKHCHWV